MKSKNDFQAQRDVIKSIAEGGPGSTRWGRGSAGTVTRTKAQISKRALDKQPRAYGGYSRQASRLIGRLGLDRAVAQDAVTAQYQLGRGKVSPQTVGKIRRSQARMDRVGRFDREKGKGK